MRVELIFLEGCPHADAARANARAALAAAGLMVPLLEFTQDDPDAPADVRAYPSPTVLVNGRDVRGENPPGARSGGPSCCVAGAPTVATILAALGSS